MHRLSFRTLNLTEPGHGEIGRRAKDYLPDMAAVTEQLTRVLAGHFALVIGESQEGIHEQVRDKCIEQGMRLVATHSRQVINQAFFAKKVAREFVYVFGV
jgi:3-oxoacyl-ACP reductase-like protein